MGNFSRQTFDELKHYVSTRLQMGVPIVDADWNEESDLRRYELRAFLRWFVGEGVPDGNDGFAISPAPGDGVDTLVLATASGPTGQADLAIDPASSAAMALGFGSDNNSATNTGAPARLVSSQAEPFGLADGLDLSIQVDDATPVSVTFAAADFADITQATAVEVVAALNAAAVGFAASTGAGNDLLLGGGDGTAEGAGRIFLDGWDAICERSINYTTQPLYDNATLAADWGVPVGAPLTTPAGARTDIVYLDVWEREVDGNEDDDIIDDDIGLETAVRTRREWAVRVAEGGAPAAPSAGHAHSVLATLTRPATVDAISADDIADRRLTGLKVLSRYDIDQIVGDAFGTGYSLDHDGSRNLAVSLREAINALLSGTLPSTPNVELTGSDDVSIATAALRLPTGDMMVVRYGGDLSGLDLRGQIIAPDGTTLSETVIGLQVESAGKAAISPTGDVWVVYESGQSGGDHVYINRYSGGAWQGDTQLTSTTDRDADPVVLAHSDGDVWVFFSRRAGTDEHLHSIRLRQATGYTPDPEVQLTSGTHDDELPTAVELDNGDIALFWHSDRDGNDDIFTKQYTLATDAWDATDTKLTSDAGRDEEARSVVDAQGTTWVFWTSNRLGDDQIFYRRRLAGSGSFGSDIQLTDGPEVFEDYTFVFADSSGGLWLFYNRTDGSSGSVMSYKRYSAEQGWGPEERLVAGQAGAFLFWPTAFEDPNGDVWVFWGQYRVVGTPPVQEYRTFYKRLIPRI